MEPNLETFQPVLLERLQERCAEQVADASGHRGNRGLCAIPSTGADWW